MFISVFYVPMYVAFEEGYFKDEGLKVNLVNGLGADKTMTALLSGDADIGFMGSEASIYVYTYILLLGEKYLNKDLTNKKEILDYIEEYRCNGGFKQLKQRF